MISSTYHKYSTWRFDGTPQSLKIERVSKFFPYYGGGV